MTRTLTGDQITTGTEFVARTGIGRLRFDDVMRVERITFGDDQFEAAR
ncbi:Uncharacterised protein [Mycobacteroides abscessus subsp. abscessus]|nr:Uncharacterised protein [Mycobacteroides abscessus subsp. abscessus]